MEPTKDAGALVREQPHSGAVVVPRRHLSMCELRFWQNSHTPSNLDSCRSLVYRQ